MSEQHDSKPLFHEMDVDDLGDREVSVMESLCMNCEEQGTTQILLTRIPLYKDVIIMSFECPHCHYSNNEIQSGGKIQDEGCKYTVKISNSKDLNRQVVKSDSASVFIPELDFEIPSTTQKGIVSTIEGILERAIDDLEQGQPFRKAADPETAKKLDEFINKLKNLTKVEKPFTIILDDPSGNSFIENPCAPSKDTAMTITHYERSNEQNKMLGLLVDDELRPTTLGAEDGEDKVEAEIMVFQTNCPSCNSPAQTNMKLVPIPNFKEVVLMATVCDKCGYKTTEVKSGSGIEEKGKKITLKVTDISDMNRDVLKSETCKLLIPELELEIMGITGKFTTLEGLLRDIKEHLIETNPFLIGDSSDNARKQKLDLFIEKLEKVICVEIAVTIILDDPAGNSYLQNVYAPEPDPEMTVEEYVRTDEQNDDLGIKDMKTEHYAEPV